MWTRKELKDKAKVSLKMNYWKTVLIALIFALAAGRAFATGGNVAGTFRNDSNGLEDDLDFQELYVFEEQDEAFVEHLDFIERLENVVDSNEYSLPLAAAFFGAAVLIVMLTVSTAIDVFLIEPLSVGAHRFSVRNLNQKAEIKEAAYAFDGNYLEIVKTMFMRNLFTFLWGMAFVIPGIVKAYEYRMIPYLLADDPTMTRERAFAESRRLMQGNKWNAFVLDLSFAGWHLLSALTLGLLELFFVAPYQFMANAALYESLRYDGPASELAAGVYAEQVPVPPFAAQDGFAPESPEA